MGGQHPKPSQPLTGDHRDGTTKPESVLLSCKTQSCGLLLLLSQVLSSTFSSRGVQPGLLIASYLLPCAACDGPSTFQPPRNSAPKLSSPSHCLVLAPCLGRQHMHKFPHGLQGLDIFMPTLAGPEPTSHHNNLPNNLAGVGIRSITFFGPPLTLPG